MLPLSRRHVVIDRLGGAILTAPAYYEIWMVLTPITDIVRDRATWHTEVEIAVSHSRRS